MWARFIIFILLSYSFLTTGQLLTFFSFVAEEQCCMLRTPHTPYWVGGYRVGSKACQIKGLEKPHML
jgi:hypothetical protein